MNNVNADDVRIVLNSYGGNCNAATRMFDDVRAYPGKVHAQREHIKKQPQPAYIDQVWGNLKP